LALWGKGFSVNTIKEVEWMKEKKIIYWGWKDWPGTKSPL
jgi:hypothetical protein